MAVFWVVAPCSMIEVYRCFRGACCLHHQGETYTRLYGATTKKTAVFIIAAVRNFTILVLCGTQWVVTVFTEHILFHHPQMIKTEM
jgi:hypothetical protein